MTGACPSCGVAVVPGYVKCPRCHAVLPRTGRIRRSSVDPGGTSVEERRSFPLVPAIAVAIAVVLFLVLGGDRKKQAGVGPEAASSLVSPGAEGATAQGAAATAQGPAATAQGAAATAQGAAATVQGAAATASAAVASTQAATAPGAAATAPGAVAPTPAPPAAAPLDIPAAGPSPGAAAAELERALGRQRLWSSVQPTGARIDVRSGTCGEPAMGPVIEAARTALRSAGLTRLRCLAQSGAVVFERDL